TWIFGRSMTSVVMAVGVAPDVDVGESKFAVGLPRARSESDRRRADEEDGDDSAHGDSGDDADRRAGGPRRPVHERGDADQPSDEQNGQQGEVDAPEPVGKRLLEGDLDARRAVVLAEFAPPVRIV